MYNYRARLLNSCTCRFPLLCEDLNLLYNDYYLRETTVAINRWKVVIMLTVFTIVLCDGWADTYKKFFGTYPNVFCVI